MWRTLRFFWGRCGAEQGTFEDELWGDAVEHATVRKAIQRANVVLEKAGVGWRLELRGGQIRKIRPKKLKTNLSQPGPGDLPSYTQRDRTGRAIG